MNCLEIIHEEVFRNANLSKKSLEKVLLRI